MDEQAPSVTSLELFPPEVLDECTMIVAEGKLPDTARFSGRIVEKSQEFVRQVIEYRLLGVPVRVVMERLHCSPHTIAAIMSRAEASGKVGTFAQRLATKIARNVEAGVDEWYAALAEGKLNASQIPLPTCMWLDKLTALMGLVGASGQQKEAEAPREVLEAKVAELRQRLRRAGPADRNGAIDVQGESESGGASTQPTASHAADSATPVPESTLESSPAADCPGIDRLTPAADPRAGSPAPARAHRGGGVALGDASGRADGSGLENSEAKDGFCGKKIAQKAPASIPPPPATL